MIIYSFQSKEILKYLSNNQTYITDKDIFHKYYDLKLSSWENAYKWIYEKMIQKIGKPSNPEVVYPVWGWYTYNWITPPKFDIKNTNIDSFPLGEDWKVMLKLNIPDNQVVLSDESSWRLGPLNNFYLCSKYVSSSSEFCKAYDDFKYLDTTEKQKATYESWDNIFDIEPFDNKYHQQGRYVQATFWEIKPEYILEFFINN